MPLFAEKDPYDLPNSCLNLLLGLSKEPHHLVQTSSHLSHLRLTHLRILVALFRSVDGRGVLVHSLSPIVMRLERQGRCKKVEQRTPDRFASWTAVWLIRSP